MVILKDINVLMHHTMSMPCNSIEDILIHGNLIRLIQSYLNHPPLKDDIPLYVNCTIEDFIRGIFKNASEKELEMTKEIDNEKYSMLLSINDFNTRMIAHLKDKGYKL